MAGRWNHIEGSSFHIHRDLFILYPFLVGGLEHVLFFRILGIIILTDELIFFRGVGGSTTNQILFGFL